MTKEALKKALEAFGEIEWSNNSQWQSDRAKVAITAIKEALANEALEKMAENARELGLDYEPEPVAWVDLLKEAQQIVESKVLWKRFIDGTPLSNDIACWMAAFAQQHTTPPQRTWVGLTDEDLEAEFGFIDELLRDTCYRTEAALKAKNT